jgi:hypothetical protein
MFKQISLYLENKPGRLSQFCTYLKENNIEIRAITVAENVDYGLILLLVDKPEDCVKLLEEANYVYSITRVLAVRIDEDKGHTQGLLEISRILGEADVNIKFLYSTLVKEESLIILRVNDDEKATKVLKEEGFLLEESNQIE